MSTHGSNSRKRKDVCLPPTALYSVLSALLLSFLLLLSPATYVFAASIQQPALSAIHTLDTSDPNLLLDGVSVVRLQVTYTGTKQSAAITVQCTGLGVLIDSWTPEANSNAINNFILTDGSLVNKNGDATCVDQKLRPASSKLSSLVVYFSKAYNRIAPFTPVSIGTPDVRCQSAACGGSTALVALHTPYANPYVSLVNTSGSIVSQTATPTTTQPTTPTTGTAGNPITGIELGKNATDTTPAIVPFIAPVVPVTHPGYSTDQLTSFLTPAAKTGQTQSGELGMPMVNDAGQLSGMRLSQGTFDAAQVAALLSAQTEVKSQATTLSNPVKANWDAGIRAYIQNEKATANTDFALVVKSNPQFQGAKDLQNATKAATAGSGDSTGSGKSGSPKSFFGFPLPAWLPVYAVWGAIAAVLLAIVLVAILLVTRRILNLRRANRDFEEAQKLAALHEAEAKEQELRSQQGPLQAPAYANSAAYPNVLKTSPLTADAIAHQPMGQGQSPLVDKPTLVDFANNGNHSVAPMQHSPAAVQCPTCGAIVPLATEICPNCRTPLAPSASGLHLVPRQPAAPIPAMNRGPIGPQVYELEDSTVPLVTTPDNNGVSNSNRIPPAPPSYRGQRLGFFAGTNTDPGIKRKYKPNEDNLFAAQGVRSSQNAMQPFGVFVVADGMGGHANGQDASRLAIQTIIDFMLPNLVRTIAVTSEDLQRLLAEGVQRANQAVHKHNMEQHADMGTTMTAALVVDRMAYIANVGDSRTYLYRAGIGLMKVTQDHSVVASLVDAGIIKPDDIYTHPKRNQIYRSLGEKPAVEVDLFVKELQLGDKLLLCSDGLWDMVRDPQIENILKRNEPDPNVVGAELIDAALKGGGEDNVSVIVVSITEPANKQGLSLDVQLIYKPDSINLPQL